MSLILKNLVSQNEQDIASLPDPTQGVDNLLQKYQALKSLYDGDSGKTLRKPQNQQEYTSVVESSAVPSLGESLQNLDMTSISRGLIGKAMFPYVDNGESNSQFVPQTATAYSDAEAGEDIVKRTKCATSAQPSDNPSPVDNRSLLNSDKSGYQDGDFDVRDVTRSGSSLSNLFRKNYGFEGSPEQLIAYASYNSLGNAHDLSENREIISPNLETLGRDEYAATADQSQKYLNRDAEYQVMRQEQSDATKSNWMSPEQAGELYPRNGRRNSELGNSPVLHAGGKSMVTTVVPELMERPVFDAMGAYAGIESVDADERPVVGYRAQMAEAIPAVGDLMMGGAKGLINGIPATLVSAGKGYAYLGSPLAEAFGVPGVTLQGTIDALDPVTGHVLDYSNGLQAMGGVAGETFSPNAYAKAPQLVVAAARALAPKVSGMLYNNIRRSGGLTSLVDDAGAPKASAEIPEASEIPEKPTAYSVAFETRLDPADFGRSRKVHFNRSNAALHEALLADPEFAALMDELIPRVRFSVSRIGTRRTPKGWVWEHASTSTASGEQGVMRLVPKVQHTPGSSWWRVLHPDPGAAGGYSEWAIPNGAPRN